MKYSYKFKLTKRDMWTYYMVDRYSTLAGIAQIIFIISLSLLIITKWNTLGPIMRILTLVGLSLFTVVQPLFFYVNAAKATKDDIPDTELSFDEEHMTIKVLTHVQKIKYENIVQVIKKPFMLIIQPDPTHIYILTNRILQNQKKELYEFLKTKIA